LDPANIWQMQVFWIPNSSKEHTVLHWYNIECPALDGACSNTQISLEPNPLGFDPSSKLCSGNSGHVSHSKQWIQVLYPQESSVLDCAHTNENNTCIANNTKRSLKWGMHAYQ
jgi:hypothetical protein